MANLTVEIDLTDTEENNMKSHLVDIDAWVLALTTEKVNNCWKRMQKKWTDQLTNDKDFTDTIPSNKADFLKLVTARSDYKDRDARDKEQAEKDEHGNPKDWDMMYPFAVSVVQEFITFCSESGGFRIG